MSERWPSLPYRKPGPNGERYCRLCGQQVSGRRQSWCSDACVEAWRIRSDGRAMRAAVAARDACICAACGLDVAALEGAVDEVRKFRWTNWWPTSESTIVRLAGLYEGRSLWQADHIVEVADGGGGCDLDNIQTLCHWCHAAKSGRSRRARNARRQGQEALAL